MVLVPFPTRTTKYRKGPINGRRLDMEGSKKVVGLGGVVVVVVVAGACRYW